MKKKVLALVFVISLVMSSFSVISFADNGTGSDVDTSDVYNFAWELPNTDRSQWYWSDTPHYTHDDSGNHTAVIFRIQDLTNKKYIPVYCSDVGTYIKEGTKYKRINLEDSTYYDAEAASHIRGVFEAGYWPTTWSKEDGDLKAAEDAANAWLDANDYPTDVNTTFDDGEEYNTSRINGLTAAQAITATQAAIWHFANDTSNFIPYGGTKNVGWTEQFFDMNVNIKEYKDAYTASNVTLFYEYLINQEAKAPEKIIFSNNHVVESEAVLTSNAFNYNISLRFKLSGDVDDEDDLTLTATLGERKIEIKLGADGSQPDENGYYSINFSGLTAKEIESLETNSIKLAVSGYQKVNGVYFYEAQPTEGATAQKTSQNLVGKAEGMTAVSAEEEINFEIGTKNVTLYKYNASVPADADTTKPTVVVDEVAYPAIKGVEFSLYTKVNGEYILLESGLTTDENGYLQVSNLPEGYEYFFKETKAASGFVPNDEYIPATGWTDQETPEYVGNKEFTTSVTVDKEWAKDDDTVRPDSVQIQLLRDGKAYGDPVTLNAENDWTYTWTELVDNHEWSVEELNVPEGYTSTITSEGNQFTITNTYRDMPDEENTYDEDKDKDKDLPEDENTYDEEDSDDKNDAVDTGDNSSIAMYMLIAMASLSALVALRAKKCN